MGNWQYSTLLCLCALLTLPLELILGARVYRRPRALARTLLPIVAVFGLWDLYGYWSGAWSYSPRHILGVRLGGLPVEEWMFFLVIPVCALLTFEVLGEIGRRGDR